VLRAARVEAGVQVAGQLIDAEGKAFAKRLPQLREDVLAGLQAAAAAPPPPEAEGAVAAPGWQEAYFLALFVDKLFAAAPETLHLPGATPEAACWPREVRMLCAPRRLSRPTLPAHACCPSGCREGYMHAWHACASCCASVRSRPPVLDAIAHESAALSRAAACHRWCSKSSDDAAG